MATKTITAMFSTRDEAERAARMLVTELGIDPTMVRTSPGTGMADTGYDSASPYAEKGFFGALKDMFVPDEDRYAYAEGMRRGSVLLNATIEESKLDRAADVLEQAGAVDLDAQEATWRQSGWVGYDANAHKAFSAKATAPVAPGNLNDDTIKVVQERLVVGKRTVEAGRVKIRTYVVERPVEETVSLHEESVHIDRHAVDRAATAADMAAFQERTIEARAVSEEAVVSKDVRVVEEIALHKSATDRTETVHDTVRETKVEIDDTLDKTRAAGTPTTRPAGLGTAAATTTTGAAASVDRTLNTNASGTNPAADAPDGTPGNPSGTMVSRAVDKTLGTNISGANPGHK